MSGRAAGPPPVIEVQPISQTVLKGASAVFSVVAVSGTTMSYQWQLNGKKINGATQSSYTVASAQYDGIYAVQVINASGSVMSSNATLHVLQPPQSNDDRYNMFENHTLTVAASGVLANDVSYNGLGLSAVLTGNVSHGTLLLGVDGSFTYIPSPNYYGKDKFNYTANDGLLTSGNTAIVTINVQQTIWAPVILTAIGMGTNGFQLQVLGPLPADYTIYASDDLVNWTTIATSSLESGAFNFTDTGASTRGKRFYRARAQTAW